MSIRTLLIWIIVAGALGGGVLLIRAQQESVRLKAPISSSRTLGFDPASTAALERYIDGDLQVLQRDSRQMSEWVIQWSNGETDNSWSVDSNKARSALRMLATTRVAITETDLFSSVGGELVIRQVAGDSVRIEFAADSSGGYTPIRVEERGSDGIATGRWYGRVERSISDAFIANGMMDWRSDRVFDIPNSAVRFVELEAGGSLVNLARSNSGWNIHYPIETHGDTEQIEDLVKVLIALEARSFEDPELDAQTTGIENPIATLKISSTNEASILKIGSRADVGGSNVYALLETPSGSALITLEMEQLAKLTASAEAYIGKTPSSLSSSDIRTLKINGRDGKTRLEATRRVGNWTIAESQADSLNRDAIDRLIGVLTREPAQFVKILDEESDITTLGSVELLGENESPLNRFLVALDSTEAGMRLLIIQELESDQRVLWATVSDEAAATGAWLTAVAGKRVP